MISLEWMFYLLISFFAVVGALRGWQREVIALAGLIGSIAALNQFGFVLVEIGTRLVDFVGRSPDTADIFFLEKRQFWVQFSFHIVIAFFSYQVIARLADNAAGNRFGDRIRIGFQRRFIGGILGLMNGYLLIGTLWAFLEYRLSPIGYERLPIGEPYAFAPDVITRPLYDPAFDIASWLPFGLINPNVWLLMFFIAFFVVIIALI